MRSEWLIISLGDQIILDTGFPFKSAQFVASDRGVKLLRGDNVGQGSLRWDGVKSWQREDADGLSKFELCEGDLVLAMDRPWIAAGLKYAKVKANDLPALLVQRVARLRPKASMYPGYLHCVVASPEFTQYIQNVTTGTAVPHISSQQIKEFKFRLPPIESQKFSGDLITAIDDQITLLREINQTLEAIAQAIFKSWFVDFDPVKAKAAGLVPGGIDEATAALFPDSFVDSDSGSTPAGWSSKTIGDVASIVGGSTPDTKNPDLWEPAEFNWTSPKDLSGLQSPVLLDTDRKISAAGLAKISSGLLPKGTLMLSSRAPIGYLAISQIPIAINQGYIAMPPGGKLPPLYLYFWCKQNMEEIKSRSNGSTFMEISKSAFRPIPAVLPPPKIIEAFMSVAGVLFEEIVAQQEEIKTLSELRDTLLPRLISGKLKLPETLEAPEIKIAVEMA